jgi:hypothetical protein
VSFSTFSTFDPIDFVFFGQIRIRFEIRTNNSNSERNRFGLFPTDFYISIFYSEWIRILNSVEPNLATRPTTAHPKISNKVIEFSIPGVSSATVVLVPSVPSPSSPRLLLPTLPSLRRNPGGTVRQHQSTRVSSQDREFATAAHPRLRLHPTSPAARPSHGHDAALPATTQLRGSAATPRVHGSSWRWWFRSWDEQQGEQGQDQEDATHFRAAASNGFSNRRFVDGYFLY